MHLKTIQQERGLLLEILDRMPHAVAMIDQEGRVIRTNRAAEVIVNSGKLKLATDGCLRLCGKAREDFAQALAQCKNPLIVTCSGIKPPKQVSVPRANGRPLILTLQTLPREWAGAFRAIALFFITDPDRANQDIGVSLQAAYGLTPAETKLVSALAEGKTLRQFARDHDVTYETARTRLRRVFEKTNTQRQAELVRLAIQSN